MSEKRFWACWSCVKLSPNRGTGMKGERKAPCDLCLNPDTIDLPKYEVIPWPDDGRPLPPFKLAVALTLTALVAAFVYWPD